MSIKRGHLLSLMFLIIAFMVLTKELYGVRCSFWKQAVQEARWYERYDATAVVFNNKIWLIGGHGPAGDVYNEVWYSTNGVDWTRVESFVGWLPRYKHTSVVFDNKIWIVGGMGKYECYNDVWYSSDGISWTQATANANWSPRFEHTLVVFDNKMWVIGGRGSSGWYNDVWYSRDGINWVQTTANAPWQPRYGHTSVAFKGKLWVIGGWGTIIYNDVWYSSDGTNWTPATGEAEWHCRSGHTSVVFGDKMWLIGGMFHSFPSSIYYNDVWYSSNGKDWELSTSSASWSPREGHVSVVFNDRIWLMSGYSSTEGGLNDIWYSNVKISGMVKRPDGVPMSGVVVTLSGDESQVTITDNNGEYSFSVDLFSNYTVTPSSGYYSFIPSSRTYLPIEDDMMNQDFVRSNSVSVIWPGEENYISDGLHPEVDDDEHDGIGPFIYKIKYVDFENDPPEIGYPKLVILKGGTTIYNIPMLESDPSDKNYKDGKLYIHSISGITAGRDYSYYFIVKDTFGATAVSEVKPGPIVSTSAPQLLWTGEVNYENDGLHPEFGTPQTTFYFRILYKDTDGDPPKSGYPKLYIKKGGEDIDGSPFVMFEDTDGGDYINGKLFYYNLLLEPSTNYTYYFEVYDEFGKLARTLEIDAPDVNTPSMLYWTGETGYESDGVEPNTGTVITTTFVFKITYKDLDNDPVAVGYPKLHILFDNKELSGSPYTMSKLPDTGEPATGEVYTYSLTISTPGVYMYYFECYEANGLQSSGLPTVISPDFTFTVVEPTPPTIETMVKGTWEVPQRELQNFTLSWLVSGEVGPEYIEAFYIYLSSTSAELPPETLVYRGMETSFKPQNLSYGVKYYWKVVVAYKYGGVYESDVYSFMLVPTVQKAYNYPNPLVGDGKTNIVFNMHSPGNVVLEIFSPFHDLLYQETYNNLPTGVNLLSWDGRKSDGSKASSGLYICRISKKYDTGAVESEIIKILIIR